MPLLKTFPGPKEPTFELDSFDKPLEVDGADAWVRDIISMAFFEPGTFVDDPDLGVNISKELFSDSDTAVATIRSKLSEACNNYLGDIPIKELSVSSYYWGAKGTYVLVVSITLETSEGPTTYAAYIATIDSQLSYIISQL